MGDEEDGPSMVTSVHKSGTRRSKTNEDAEDKNGSNSDSEGCSKKIARSSVCPSRLNHHFLIMSHFACRQANIVREAIKSGKTFT